MKRELTRMDKVASATSFGLCSLRQCDAVRCRLFTARVARPQMEVHRFCCVVLLVCACGAGCGGWIVNAQQKEAIHCIHHICAAEGGHSLHSSYLAGTQVAAPRYR